MSKISVVTTLATEVRIGLCLSWT